MVPENSIAKNALHTVTAKLNEIVQLPDDMYEKTQWRYWPVTTQYKTMQKSYIHKEAQYLSAKEKNNHEQRPKTLHH